MTDATPAAAPPRRGAGGYGRVLALLVASLVAGGLLTDRAGVIAAAGLGLVLWLAVARAAALGRRTTRAGMVVLAVVFGFALATLATDAAALGATADLLLAGAVAGIATMIGRSLVRQQVVTFSTVAAVLCVYLLIGLFFAQAYLGISALDSGAFAGLGADPYRFEFIYFSFIALTTVGFGDITPVADIARALAATEAVTGQLFLVTVVARVVSLIGHERLKR